MTTSGAYTNTDGSGGNIPNTDSGDVFTAKSDPYISWDGKTWSSKGTGTLTSTASVEKKPDAKSGVSEGASARAVVMDPRTFSATFNPNTNSPSLLFSFTIQAGAKLGMLTGQGLTGTASMSGNDQTSLLASDLWSFSWSVDQLDPNKTDFLFQSNPVFGLDDAAIQAGFQSSVSGSLGQFSLMQDFVVTGNLPVTLPPDSNTLLFTTSGVIQFDATAASVPEPGSGLLIVSGIPLIIWARRRALSCRFAS